ncbi:MAG: hypothetical protein RLZZ519_1393 [Bacteroidota bacterium]|jgi:hypothetical protein
MKFSKNLFWDTDESKLDFEANARSIIARVSERGRQEDWFEILRYYGENRLREEVVQIRSIEPKTLAFLSLVLEIPIESFRCYKEQQSFPELYHY